MSNTFLYFNRNAARMDTRAISDIEQTFKNAGLPTKTIYELQDLQGIREAHVVIFGGDGSIHQVLNHADIDNVSFSFVKSGSGNDLLKNFPPSTLEALIEKIKLRQYSSIDCIDLGEGRICVNACGFGFDALVAKRAAELPAKLKQLRYSVAVLQHIFSFKPIHVIIRSVEFNYTGPAYMLSAGNGGFAGGGFKLYPHAAINDGKLDILLIKPITFWDKLKYVRLVKEGRHLQLPVLEYFQSSRVEISFENETLMEADGEMYQGRHFALEILPLKIRVIL